MKPGSWLLGLVVVAFASLSPSFADRGVALDSSEEEGKNYVKPTNRQQKPFTSSEIDQETAATEFGSESQKFHKGDNHGYHNALGHKGSKDYHDNESYYKNRQGDYGKHHKTDNYDKGGELYHGHEHDQNHHKNSHEGYKGSAGHLKGSKGHSKKGHKNSGFKNLYHKEEYGVSKRFYDDKTIADYLDKHDHFGADFKGHEAGFIKGGAYEGGEKKDHYADKGVFDQGRHFKSEGGQKSARGTSSHHGDDSSYGNKEGYHNKNGYDFQGFGHDSLHDGYGYGGTDHHGGQGYKNLHGGHKYGNHNKHSYGNHQHNSHGYGGYDDHDGRGYDNHSILHQGGHGPGGVNGKPWGRKDVYTGYEPARHDTRFKHSGSHKEFEPRFSPGIIQTGHGPHKYTRPHDYKGLGRFATGYSHFNVRRRY